MSYLRIFLIPILMLVCQISMGAQYDPLLLRAQASMFPKIMMLDQDIANKANNGVVSMFILYKSEDGDIAKNLKKLIEEKYGNKLGNMTLEVKLAPFSDTNNHELATAYFLLQGTPEIHNSLTQYAQKNNRLVFCYDHNDFKHKTLISLLVKEKTYIYMNKSAIHDYDIKFQPVFYKIIKVIE